MKSDKTPCFPGSKDVVRDTVQRTVQGRKGVGLYAYYIGGVQPHPVTTSYVVTDHVSVQRPELNLNT